MLEIRNSLYPPKDDTRVSHRRYDAKERLIAWSVSQDGYFLIFRASAFREVTLGSGEMLEIPERIECRFSQTDIDPDLAFADTFAYDSCGNVIVSSDQNPSGTYAYKWAGRERETETALQFNRARH